MDHQPEKSSAHPDSKAGRRKRPGPPGGGGVPGGRKETVGGGPEVARPPHHRGGVGRGGTPQPAPGGAGSSGAPGRDGDHLPHEDPPGGPVFGPASGDGAPGDTDRGPVSGAGRRSGPGQRGDHLAHRRRPGGGRPDPGGKLRRPIQPQQSSAAYGGLLPPAGV